jgi:uncharacterized protein (DUF488 family)
MKLYTIGFTQKDAETFFETLKANDVRNVLDIRYSNNSQFAGFTKRDDLPYLLRKIGGICYRHWEDAAPTADLIKRYRDGKITWTVYRKEYTKLIGSRKVADDVTAAELNKACLLCAEPEADRCHRRVLAEYLKTKFPNVEIVHL